MCLLLSIYHHIIIVIPTYFFNFMHIVDNVFILVTVHDLKITINYSNKDGTCTCMEVQLGACMYISTFVFFNACGVSLCVLDHTLNTVSF